MKELFDRLVHDPATVRKFIVAFLTALGILVAQGVFNGPVEGWVITVLAIANALGVYRVPNAKDSVNVNERLGIVRRNSVERGSIGGAGTPADRACRGCRACPK